MNNKKLALMCAAAVMTAAFCCACGSSNTVNDTTGSTSNSSTTSDSSDTTASADAYSFTLDGTTIAANAQMAPIVEALGEADSYFESESCAFQGLDKVYTYGSVVISTYPVDEVDYVYTIELKDDTVSTPEGIYIGSSADDVLSAYSDAGDIEQTDSAISITKGDCTLAFILEDGVVTNITYTAITE